MPQPAEKQRKLTELVAKILPGHTFVALPDRQLLDCANQAASVGVDKLDRLRELAGQLAEGLKEARKLAEDLNRKREQLEKDRTRYGPTSPPYKETTRKLENCQGALTLLGEYSAELESLCSKLTQAQSAMAPEAEVFSKIKAACDDLHQLLNDRKAGQFRERFITTYELIRDNPKRSSPRDQYQKMLRDVYSLVVDLQFQTNVSDKWNRIDEYLKERLGDHFLERLQPVALKVTSYPTGARISIDKVEQPQRTDATLELPPRGTIWVRVELEGYDPQEDSITLLPGKAASKHFDLKSSFKARTIISPQPSPLKETSRSAILSPAAQKEKAPVPHPPPIPKPLIQKPIATPPPLPEEKTVLAVSSAPKTQGDTTFNITIGGHKTNNLPDFLPAEHPVSNPYLGLSIINPRGKQRFFIFARNPVVFGRQDVDKDRGNACVSDVVLRIFTNDQQDAKLSEKISRRQFVLNLENNKVLLTNVGSAKLKHAKVTVPLNEVMELEETGMLEIGSMLTLSYEITRYKTANFTGTQLLHKPGHWQETDAFTAVVFCRLNNATNQGYIIAPHGLPLNTRGWPVSGKEEKAGILQYEPHPLVPDTGQWFWLALAAQECNGKKIPAGERVEVGTDIRIKLDQGTIAFSSFKPADMKTAHK